MIADEMDNKDANNTIAGNIASQNDTAASQQSKPFYKRANFLIFVAFFAYIILVTGISFTFLAHASSGVIIGACTPSIILCIIAWLLIKFKGNHTVNILYIMIFALLSILALVFAGVFNSFISILFLNESQKWVLPVIIAPIVEETMKFIYISWCVSPNFDYISSHPKSIIMYGITVASSFALLENITYTVFPHFGVFVQNPGAQTVFMTVLFRALMSIPCHSTTGAIIGIKVAALKFSSKNGALHNESVRSHLGSFCGVWTNFLSIIWFPMLLHAIFNLCATFLISFGTIGLGLFVCVGLTMPICAWEVYRESFEHNLNIIEDQSQNTSYPSNTINVDVDV